MVGDEGVGGSLLTECGHRTVSWNERDLISEREQLFLD